MDLEGAVAVITGAGAGIGEAMARRFAAEGARVVVSDIDEAAAQQVAGAIDGLAVRTDVSSEGDIRRLVALSEATFGPIDLMCSNAGIAIGGGVEVPNETWQRAWDVNLMPHVHAARAVLPGMIERGGGYLLQTASAAGLLTNLGAAPYSVTKHAAVALAEWLAITYADRGIKVSALCPMFVTTALLDDLAELPGGRRLIGDDAIDPAEVAEGVVAGLAEERFLILPHPAVLEFFRRKATDYDRWIAGMARLQDSILDEGLSEGP